MHLTYHENVSLKPLHTLQAEATARYLIPASSEQDIVDISNFALSHQLPLIPLGQGSNVVFRHHVEAVVMPVVLHGCSITYHGSNALFSLQAGENWHQWVRKTLLQGWHGLENLSLIPGTVGAAPVQNIGAYGTELKDLLVQVRGYHRLKKEFISLPVDKCQFGYRDSIFKHRLYGNFIITEVTLRLQRKLSPHLSYGQLASEVENFRGDQQLTGMHISDAICHIRNTHLPDPAVLNNAGSFFKNPVVSSSTMEIIRRKYEDVIAYPLANGRWKLAAGWLIDSCGLKGYRRKAVGVYERQALILVNYGQTSGEDILALATTIQQRVHKKFNVHLDIEPQIYPRYADTNP